MKSLILGLFVFIYTLLIIQANTLKTTFIEDLCFIRPFATIELRNEISGILMSVPSHNSNGQFQCQLTLLPERGYSVVLSIFRYDIATVDELIIEDSDRHRIGLIGYATFKDEKKSIISDGKLTIKYTRNDTAYAGYSNRRGFQFTYTKVNEYNDKKCSANQFHCKNNRCIPKYLVCDGHNHCGDNSDQNSCVPGGITNEETGPETNHLIILNVLIAAGVIFLILIVVLIVLIVRLYKKRQTEERNSNDAGMEILSANVPPHDSHRLENNIESSTQPNGSFVNRIRRSLRSQRRSHVEEELPKQHETPHVRSIYPNLNQSPSAPELRGEENPSYNNKE